MPEDPQLPEDIFTTTDKVPPAKEPQAVNVSAPQVSAPPTPPPPPPSPMKPETQLFEKKPEPKNLDDAIAEADKEVRESAVPEMIPSQDMPDDIFMPAEQPSIPKSEATSEPAKEKHSSLKVIGLLFAGFIIIAGGVAAGYFYFGENFSSLFNVSTEGNVEIPAPVNGTSGDVTGKTEEQKPDDETSAKPVIDTSAWLTYANDDLGITLKYPGTLKITSDALPKNPKDGTADTTLLIENSDKSERFVIWAHPEGLAAFTLPIGGELNPLSAGTQLILKRGEAGLIVSRTSYQSFSGVVSPNASYIVAYTTDVIGGVRYVMLYTSTGDAVTREETLKAIVASVTLKLDTDGDGLFDDEEKTYGTDPAKADTDGDSFSDGVEVKNGYNPLGEGKLNS